MINLIGNNHEILDVLVQGGMGTVYASKNVHEGQRVAIKSLHARGTIDAHDPDLLRFEQEARIASARVGAFQKNTLLAREYGEERKAVAALL